MKRTPPEFAVKFLRWFCHEDHIDEVEGDLVEIFSRQCQQSPRKATFKYAWSVLKHFRPEFIKSFKTGYHINPLDMFRHNILITYRNFVRHKSSFIINLAGLSAGLASAFFIYLWVYDEMSVDRFHEKDEQLYQVFQHFGTGADVETIEYTPGVLATALVEEMPEVEYATSVVPPYWFSNDGIITAGDTRMKIAAQYVSRDYFKVFTCPLIEGNKDQPLMDKRSVVLSESLAIKLFHTTENLIGKIVHWGQDEAMDGEFHITGIFKDVPANASVKFDAMFNYDLFFEKRPGLANWSNSDPCTYVILRKGTDVERFNKKIADLKRQKTANAKEGTFSALRYSSKYLYGSYQLEHGGQGGGRIRYVNLFATIAVFILVIACINFMNLSTARASVRMKEIGVKKAIGAGRKTMMWQYLSEAMMVAFLSLIVAAALVGLFLPAFNQVTGKSLVFQFDIPMVLALLAITVVTGLISGSYPALYLSGFNPATVLKGKLTSSLGEVWARKGLVVFQFTISVVLIVSVLIVYNQLAFMQSKNLGYKRDNLISFEAEWKGTGSVASLMAALKTVPGVMHVSCYYHNLLGDHGGLSDITWEGKSQDVAVDYANLEVGFEFIQALGIEMAEGHTFSRDIDPRRQIIFNETAIRQMGISDPVGKMIKLWGDERQIVGIAKDFNFESLYEEIKPCFFQPYPELPNIMVKVQGGTTQATLQHLEKVYHKFSPGLTFDYKFLDAEYQALYAAEQRIGVLSRCFAGIAIVISCLGLFGLAAFTTERRMKEIGIRKILGATTVGIVSLLSTDFTKMVLISIGIAFPVSYLIGYHWLQGFAYRIEPEWWFFVSAGVVTLFIAWITVSTQTLKAAGINPVQTLKTE